MADTIRKGDLVEGVKKYKDDIGIVTEVRTKNQRETGWLTVYWQTLGVKKPVHKNWVKKSEQKVN